MDYKRSVFENSFSIQIQELFMDFVGNKSGVIILDLSGYPRVNIDYRTRVISSTYSLDVNPKFRDIISRMSFPVSVNQVWK